MLGTANTNTNIDKHTEKKKATQHHSTDGHQTKREENKKGSEEKRPTNTNTKQLRRW